MRKINGVFKNRAIARKWQKTISKAYKEHRVLACPMMFNNNQVQQNEALRIF